MADSIDSFGDADVAPRIPQLMREAGLSNVTKSGKVQSFGMRDGYKVMARTMRRQLEKSRMLENWNNLGLIKEGELEMMKDGLEVVENSPDGLFFSMDIEVLGWKASQ